MQPLKRTVRSFTGFFHPAKPEPINTFPLYNLPTDILRVIFGFLSQDLRKVGSTCNKFRKITQMHDNFVLGNLRGKLCVLRELYRILQQCQNDKSLLAQISHSTTDYLETFKTTDTHKIIKTAYDLELLNSREIKSDVRLFAESEIAMQQRIDEILDVLSLRFRFYSCLKIDANGDDFCTKGIYDALKKSMNKHISSSDFSFIAPLPSTSYEIKAYTPLMFYNTLLNLRYFRRFNLDLPIQGTISSQIFNLMSQKLTTMEKVKTLILSHSQKDHFDWFANNRLEFLKKGISKMPNLKFVELRKSEWTTGDIADERSTVKTLANIVLLKAKKPLKRIVLGGPWHIENVIHFIDLLKNYSHLITICNTQTKSFDTEPLFQVVNKNKKNRP